MKVGTKCEFCGKEIIEENGVLLREELLSHLLQLHEKDCIKKIRDKHSTYWVEKSPTNAPSGNEAVKVPTVKGEVRKCRHPKEYDYTNCPIDIPCEECEYYLGGGGGVTLNGGNLND